MKILAFDTETGSLYPNEGSLLTAHFAILDENLEVVDSLSLKTKPDLKKQFDKLEEELLTHKYHYYVLNSPLISDYEYDMKERKFFELGAELGIDMETYPNWIDFDYRHPKALNVIKNIENGANRGS